MNTHASPDVGALKHDRLSMGPHVPDSGQLRSALKKACSNVGRHEALTRCRGSTAILREVLDKCVLLEIIQIETNTYKSISMGGRLDAEARFLCSTGQFPE